ncbi:MULTISPECIES: hypothetical protein [Moraxella]|nr:MULTISPECIES: hypothetical protein [Moraxella]MDH9219346.1 hypothetical protein [Moraxella lacunata]OBX64768.1 hypothetical protein A9Z63_02705 [Moraxella lacunata]
MHIQCQKCNHYEEVNLKFFINIIGGAVVGSGYWAWTAYLFAGTGFAMPICIAIMTGGVAMLAFSDEIVAWIAKRYDCPKCQSNQWVAVDIKRLLAEKLTQNPTDKQEVENDDVLKKRMSSILSKAKNGKHIEKDEKIQSLLNQIEGLQFLLGRVELWYLQ